MPPTPIKKIDRDMLEFELEHIKDQISEMKDEVKEGQKECQERFDKIVTVANEIKLNQAKTDIQFTELKESNAFLRKVILIGMAAMFGVSKIIEHWDKFGF